MGTNGAKLPAVPGFAAVREPPYWVVVFTSRLRPRITHDDRAEHQAACLLMLGLAERQPGLLGVESARDEDGLGILVSYWDSEESIRAWRADAEHTIARQTGRGTWYERYTVRVGMIGRSYSWDASTDAHEDPMPDSPLTTMRWSALAE
ncbi:MAG: antibiotic biosynthesis monooxygenase [Kineosporiaceae bacterium]